MAAGSSRGIFSKFFPDGRNKRASGFLIVKTKVLPLLGRGLALSIELITVVKEC